MYFRNVFSGYSVDREGYSKNGSDNLHKKHNGLLYGTYVHNVPYAQCPIEVQSQGRKKQALSHCFSSPMHKGNRPLWSLTEE